MRRRLSLGKRVAGLAVEALALPLWLARRLRPASPVREVRSILVVEIWGIGDVVLATGALAALRRRYPSARIVLLAKPHAAPLIDGRGLADEVIGFEFPWTRPAGKYRVASYLAPSLRALIRRLRAERFDLSLDARMDVRSNLLTYVVGARRRIGLAHGGGTLLLTDRVPAGDVDAHRTEDWAALARRADAAPDDDSPVLPLRTEERLAADERLAALGVARGEPVIAVHAGGSSPVKRWAPERFAAVAAELAARRGARVVWLENPGDGVRGPAPRPSDVVLHAPLGELPALLARAELLLCNDSGPMHVAAAVGTPVLALFGPARREWFAPQGPAHRVVARDELSCRPCFDQCRFAEPYCLTRIEVADVLRAAGEGRGAEAQGRAAPGSATVVS